MKLKTTLFGNVYQFKDVKEVLAKANELRSGDVLAGVAAASSQERVAAKQVLSEMTVADIRNNPVIAYEDDCVTRLIQDDVNETAYNQITYKSTMAPRFPFTPTALANVQMRGRVGRSNKKAFCYLMAPPKSALTPEARRRLFLASFLLL